MHRITHNLRLKDGEPFLLIELAKGGFVCPVCGFPAVPEPPYAPTWALGADPTREEDAFATGSIEPCPCCHTFFGDTDFSTTLSLQDKWRELRMNWVARVGWSAESLRELADHLGLDEEQLRR